MSMFAVSGMLVRVGPSKDLGRAMVAFEFLDFIESGSQMGPRRIENITAAQPIAETLTDCACLTLFLVSTPGATVHRAWAVRLVGGHRLVDGDAVRGFIDGTLFQPQPPSIITDRIT